MTLTRTLGRSGLQVSALGFGTNSIGGSYWDRSVRSELPVGYGPVDATEAIRAIGRAVDLGINFFDTADEYGCGQSETLLGRALEGRRQDVVIATKFGLTFDETAKEVTGQDCSPQYIHRACEASLRRLKTDWIDLYQLHLRDVPLEQASIVRDTLEELVAEGRIRWYGWSTDDVQRARFFAEGPHCTAVQHRLNVFLDNQPMLALCEEMDLASINRIPLLMGILTGRFQSSVDLPAEDVRGLFFRGSHFERDLERLEMLRSVLTADGRSLVQGALGWIWARSSRTIPIPGFRTVIQVEENAGARSFGPLDSSQMQRIDRLLGRME